MENAIQAIYRDLDYAKSLIKNRNATNAAGDYELGVEEESWTFIGDESDPELVRRIKGWDSIAAMTRKGMSVVDEDAAAVVGPEMKDTERSVSLE